MDSESALRYAGFGPSLAPGLTEVIKSEFSLNVMLTLKLEVRFLHEILSSPKEDTLTVKLRSLLSLLDVTIEWNKDCYWA
ncbi:hypothetical protein PoB_005001600 [Plakobranchus ocellatus]|uniref:Uncharacterized protein n=1 Tax=Plakobranchus ocellatus TaxID=259542 RepID=A0AAV4BSS4_9GAST|nr:hypothetical protein PoB_005001600 [Plakobranchus ocellatus]